MWPGGPGRLPAQGSHRSVRGHTRPYGSSKQHLRFAGDATSPRTRQSLSVGVTLTPNERSKPLRCFSPTAWLLDASLPIPRVLAGQVPRLQRYYQGTATSCRSSHRVSFPSLGGTTYHADFAPAVAACGNVGPGVGHPVSPSGTFRGNDRISQVPGEPQFPFAHGLRPRPAETSQTNCGTFAWPPLSA